MNKNILSMIPMLMLFLPSCLEEYVEPDLKDFSISEKEIFDEGAGSTGKLELKTTDATMWQIVPQQEEIDWAVFSASEGKGSLDVGIRIAENMTLDMRTAKFAVEAYLYGEHYQTDTLLVSQAPQSPFFQISPDASGTLNDVFCLGKTVDFVVRSNVSWTLSGQVSPEDPDPIDSWCTFSPGEGSGKQVITVEFKENPVEVKRTGYLQFTIQELGLSGIEISQAPFAPQEVPELKFRVPGMTGFVPDGTGQLTLKDTKTDKALSYEVKVTGSDEGTLIEFLDKIYSGNYQLLSCTSSGVEYPLPRMEFIPIMPDTKEIVLDGWIGDFNTFCGKSQEDPIIMDAEGLRKLAEKVNGGNPFAGLHFALAGPVDLGMKNWIAIGANATVPFSGNFDGRNHEISGFVITRPNPLINGFFGVVKGTDPTHPAIIQNMVFKGHDNGTLGMDMSDSQGLAGVVCAVAAENAIIRNCVNHLNLRLSYGSGGIVGYAGADAYIPWLQPSEVNVLVENCHNHGDIEVKAGPAKPAPPKHFNVGGVVGGNKGIISRCSNTGSITNVSAPFFHVGGINGYNAGAVKECYNTGRITGPITAAAGIVGMAAAARTSIENCYNTAEVNAGKPSGGILATTPDRPSGDLTIKNCYNTGIMHDDAAHNGGGIVGVLNKKPKVSIQFCISTKRPSFNASNEFKDGLGYTWGERLKGFLTLEKAMKKSTYTTDKWDENGKFQPNWDFVDVWAIDEGKSLPYLKNNEQIEHPVF